MNKFSRVYFTTEDGVDLHLTLEIRSKDEWQIISVFDAGLGTPLPIDMVELADNDQQKILRRCEAEAMTHG